MDTELVNSQKTMQEQKTPEYMSKKARANELDLKVEEMEAENRRDLMSGASAKRQRR